MAEITAESEVAGCCPDEARIKNLEPHAKRLGAQNLRFTAKSSIRALLTACK